MTAGKNRVHLALESLEDRCTPSAFGGVAPPLLTQHGRPYVPAAVHVRAAKEHAIPIKLAFQCSGDVSSKEASAAGFATRVGRWTGTGRFEETRIDFNTDQGEVSGTLTVVTAKGDKLFVSFTSKWQLSTGKGTETIKIEGGTGRYAGASGEGILSCIITQDPANPTTFRCNCKGSGTLVLAKR